MDSAHKESGPSRPMGPGDFCQARIPTGKYSNPQEIVGFDSREQGGSTLHPVSDPDEIESQLFTRYKNWATIQPDFVALRRHVQMPYWRPDELRIPTNYHFVKAPKRLSTTSITVLTVPNEPDRDPAMGFFFDGHQLPSLRERKLQEENPVKRPPCLDGNLGYFTPAGLFARGPKAHPWTHNNRYPEYQLPEVLSYIGFYWFVEKGQVFSTFNGAHPAAVGIRTDRTIEILPKIDISGYLVRLLGHQFSVNAINQPAGTPEVMVFTPGLRGTQEIETHLNDWVYPFRLPNVADARVNVFIANEGNGRIPIERVITVWEGPAPLPSFGAVLSFEKAYFEACFGPSGRRRIVGQQAHILPTRSTKGNTDLDQYKQVLGGLVPVVVQGEHIYHVASIDELEKNLDLYGNARSPVAECGRESRNFSPRIREPAGVFIQTNSRIGWILFDGRHELSIGANVADVGRILNLLEEDPEVRDVALTGERIKNAIFIDGGSAMKVYASHESAEGLSLDLLNRVAPGGRNRSGVDPDGLNMYTSLRLLL